MSYSRFVFAACTAVLVLLPAHTVSAIPAQEAAIAGSDTVLELAGTAFWNNAYYCDAVGDHVFLTMDFGLLILDVSDKSDPQVVSRLYLPSSTSRLQVVGNYAYICGGGDLSTGTNWATLTIVDVSDLAHPQVVGCYQSPDSVVGSGVKVVGNYAYVAGGMKLYIIRISNPANPYLVSSLSYAGAVDLEVLNDTAFVTGPSRVFAADVSDPYNPSHVFPTIMTGTNWCNGIEVGNGLIYLANGDSGLTIIDPYHGSPYVLSNYPLDTGYWSWCMSRDLVLVDDTIVFIGGELTNTMNVLNVADPYNVDSIARCGGGGDYARGMDLDSDYLYVARFGDGLYINDVSVRTWPREVGVFRESEGEPIDIKVRGSIGYLLFDDTIRIVDLSNPANMTPIGWAKVGVNSALEIAGNVMLVGNTIGVTSFDVGNPANPVYLNQYWTDYHYVTGIQARGNYAYITMWRYGYGVIDISDPAHLAMVGSLIDADYWPSEDVTGTSALALIDGYAVAGFYSQESMQSGILFIDVSDPTNPQPANEYVLPSQLACFDVMGSLLYYGHDGSDTVFVLDISDPLNPERVASWHPTGSGYFKPDIISHTGGLLLVTDEYSGDLLVVDPSGWSEGCGGGEIARFVSNSTATNVAAESNHIYMTSMGGLVALTLGLDFVCGDVDGSGGFGPDIADLVYLVNYMFNWGPTPPDMTAANIDGQPGITITDLIFLVDFMFNGGSEPICE